MFGDRYVLELLESVTRKTYCYFLLSLFAAILEAVSLVLYTYCCLLLTLFAAI